MKRLLRPLLVYGLGIVLLSILFVIWQEGSSTILDNLIYSLSFSMPYVPIPVLIGHFIHSKFSKYGYFGGLLSGILLMGLSTLFGAVSMYLWDLYKEYNGQMYLFWGPDSTFIIYLYVGSLFGIPLGMVLGVIYHHIFIKNKK